MGKKVTHAHLLGLVHTYLKAVILAKGADIYVTAEQCVKAEKEFDLRINPDETGFRLSLSQGEQDQPTKLRLPSNSDLWTP